MCNNIMYVFLLISLVYVVFSTYKIHVQVQGGKEVLLFPFER